MLIRYGWFYCYDSMLLYAIYLSHVVNREAILKNVLKEKMLRHEKVLGTFFESGSSTAVECLGLAQLDFFIIDTEHGPFDVESAMDFIRAAELSELTPLVRVKDASRPSILKMLDIGAKGLIIPNIETVDEVRKVVEYGKYYPLGKRGFAPARGAGFGFKPFAQDIDAYFKTCNSETLLIPQCETLGCLEHIEDIVRMEGVDGIFIGPYDLSVAMGKPAKFDDPQFCAAVGKVLGACKAAGKFAFIYAGNKPAVKQYFMDGFDAIAHNMDTIVYTNAYRQLVEELKA